MRLVPKSLLGQVMLAVTVTLLIVQAANAILAWNIERDRAEAALVNTLGLRFVASARPQNMERRGRIEARRMMAEREGRRPPGERRFANTDFRRMDRFVTFPSDKPLPSIERQLAETLQNNGRDFTELRVVERRASDDPVAQRFLRRLAMRRGLQERELPQTIAVAGISQGDGWEIVRAPIRMPNRHFGPVFSTARTVVLTGLLWLVLWLVLRRITRPLAQLTRRTERFSEKPAATEPMEPTGPEDVRRLIAAHNAMEARIGAMLDEKDVMLGAIGHDLKTPLAALRVRIESVEDETARGKMADGIEDITRTLDEILALARIGKSDTPPERTDLAALTASVVEEFEDMGETVGLEVERIVAPVHLTWLKRGLRNLVSNALRYGGDAHVTLLSEADHAILRVDDTGPGIPEHRIADMLEPFTRGEASRNRATGGAGLGLTLARAVAEQHGGTLTLSNRPEGGLRAEFRLPL